VAEGHTRISTDRIGFIGTGAAGGTLARALAARGAHITAVAARIPEHARELAALLPGNAVATTAEGVIAASDLVFLAVPDDVVAPLAVSLSWRAGQGAVHLSGARGAMVLAPARARGAAVAALHPLMTFTRADRDSEERALRRFSGCTWALEASDGTLRATLEDMVTALDGYVISLAASDRVPYHLSAVLVSNYVVALLGAATHLWGGFGVAPDVALQALLPLLRASVDKLATEGLPQALTGPIARGDAGTVTAHLAWMEAHAPNDAQVSELRDAYAALGRLALPLAVAKAALSPDMAARLAELLLPAERRNTPPRSEEGQADV
jgi:predicted short-subunit dehydrogenase-like oxidoreductase (DUF2520 family)